LPEPLAPEVTVMNDALLVAIHPQPASAVTFTLPVPPPAPNEADDAFNEKLQPPPS
jgi:hypothetical protein